MTLPNIYAKLHGFQHGPFRDLLEIFSQHRSAADLSSTGCGKTFVACAVMTALRLPTLVVGPKISETQWHSAAAHFGETISFIGYDMLRTGRTPFGTWQRPAPQDASDREYFQCVVCQCRVDKDAPLPCHCHAAGIHCITTKRKPHRYGRFIFSPAVKFLIADEIHKCSALDSLNADIIIAARRQGILTLGLSATIGSSPLHFRAIGYLLGIHNLDADPSFWRWASKHGARPDPIFRGLKWQVSESKQAEVMRDIRASILPERGVRISTSEIPDFPEVDITAELFDLEGSGKIDEVYLEMKDSLDRLADRAAQDVSPDSAITIMLRAQQKVELLKVPLFVEIAESYVEKGISVGVFINFQETMDQLARKLATTCLIDGSPRGMKFRQRNIDAFQANESKLILVNNSAGGIALSLHDLHGGHPRGGLVSPGFSATNLRQVLGRFPRVGGKSKSFYRVILAAGTVETKIHRALRAKLNCLDSLLDSDLAPDNLSFDNG